MNLTNALGWTLLHFVWQGALIALLLAGALAMLRQAGSAIRYVVSCAAMLLMPICAAATFLELRFAGTLPEHSAPRLTMPTITGFPAQVHGMDAVASAGTVMDIAAWFPALVWAWFAGVVALSIRSVGGWAVAERFARRHTSRAEAVWEERLAALAARLSISKPVRLAVSGLAQVPAVVGWLRPIVLVPASVFTGLTAEQIDALLTHELAHVRRHDYLINLLQTAAETLFFYHPAVWWVSRKIREERENCCDDLAVEICGSTVAYVRALTNLEQMRKTTPRLAMAADAGSLLNRVQRLLRVKAGSSRATSNWTAGLGIVAALLVAGIAADGMAQRAEPGAAVSPEPAAVTTDGQQNADAILRNAEPVLKSVNGAMHRIEVLRQEHAQAGLESAETQHMMEATAQLEAALRQIAGIAPQSAEARSVRAAMAQMEAALQRQIAQARQQQGTPAQPGWLDEIQAAGYRDLDVDKLIEMKIQGVTGEYIRQMRAEGLELTADQLVEFREQGVTADFIRELKQTGLRELNADKIVELKVQGADPAWIRQIQSLGYPNVSVDDAIELRDEGVTAEFIREARTRFKAVTIDQLIQLKQLGILKTP
jgi:beta-lactamase regulating signal transducer with metallopeptidase domain